MLDPLLALSKILPIIAGTLVITVVTVNFYLRIRSKFSAKVNCWFCNTWSKVKYDDRNSFDCPNCLQYNGFTKDGDYNKVILEQHDELMNKRRQRKTIKNSSTNGLCGLCNNNQQLKVFQLAHFVPLVEENYDVEIEHFQKQLDKAYKLCRKCDKVLKSTIERQNARIFGNHIKKFCSNGISSCKKMTAHIKDSKWSILRNIDQFLSFCLILIIIFVLMVNVNIFTRNLRTYIPTTYLSVYNNTITLVNNTNKFKILIPYLLLDVKFSVYLATCVIGLSYQLMHLIRRKLTAIKINRILCWLILTLINWVAFKSNYVTYILMIQGFSCAYLVSTVFIKEESQNMGCNKIKSKSMRKIVKNLENTCTDFSEAFSDFENISTSSSSTVNKSICSTDVPQRNSNTANSSLLNSTFTSQKLPFGPNFYEQKPTEIDLNKSLHNLNLGFKSPLQTSSLINLNVKRPKPVLSPPRLQHINSWVADGYWQNNERALLHPTISRASSESSGFGSQNEFNPPKSQLYKTSFNSSKSPFLCDSVHSGHSRTRSTCPNYLFSPVEFRNNAFYPKLRGNDMLLVEKGLGGTRLVKGNGFGCANEKNWSDAINLQATQSFRDLSLHSN